MEGKSSDSAAHAALLKLISARQTAVEHQRRLIQGLGRPITSLVDGAGARWVVVGNRSQNSTTWITFFDFLSDYVKGCMGEAWGTAEIAKLWEHRHPFVQWYDKLCIYQKLIGAGAPGVIFTGQMTGAVRAYYGLAYDLYLAEHNAHLPPQLLTRLRKHDQFEGALYEAFVVGSFAKAGFEIAFEDEGDSSRSHCEFTATHKTTRRRFSVECKSVTTRSARAGASEKAPRVRDKLYDALCKQADHERIVFIELNRETSRQQMDWANDVLAELDGLARRLKVDGVPAPPAYVVVTNRSFLHHLDDMAFNESYATYGFKIHDYPPSKGARRVWDAVRARRRHIEMHYLLKAIGTHTDIPGSFDERLPEEVFLEQTSPRLLIGHRYLVPDETGADVEGELEDATVTDRWMHGIYRLNDGRRIHCRTPMSEAELTIYRKIPDTFFGVLKHVGSNHEDALSFFEAMHEVYVNAPRARLLEWMTDWRDNPTFDKLSDIEVSEYYCARVAESAAPKS